MKDLYLRLKIDERCGDVDNIRMAIESCADADTSAAATHVLLAPKRKQFYDRYHRTLSMIGEIKAELAVPPSAAWEQLGCQDFDMEYPANLAELFADLEDLDEEVEVPKPPLRRTHSGDIDLQTIARIVFVAALAGALIIATASISSVVRKAMSSTTDKTLPRNGHVVKQASFQKRSYLDIKNPGPGHVLVDIYSMSNELLVTVLVREGLEASVGVPEGKHRLEFSIGNTSDWDDKRFRKSTNARKLKATEVEFRSNGRTRLKIPS